MGQFYFHFQHGIRLYIMSCIVGFVHWKKRKNKIHSIHGEQNIFFFISLSKYKPGPSTAPMTPTLRPSSLSSEGNTSGMGQLWMGTFRWRNWWPSNSSERSILATPYGSQGLFLPINGLWTVLLPMENTCNVHVHVHNDYVNYVILSCTKKKQWRVTKTLL